MLIPIASPGRGLVGFDPRELPHHFTDVLIIGGGLAVHQPKLQELIKAGLAKDGFTDVRFLSVDPVHGVDYLLRTGAL